MSHKLPLATSQAFSAAVAGPELRAEVDSNAFGVCRKAPERFNGTLAWQPIKVKPVKPYKACFCIWNIWNGIGHRELRPHCKIKQSVTGSTADRYPPVLCPFVDPREVSGL